MHRVEIKRDHSCSGRRMHHICPLSQEKKQHIYSVLSGEPGTSPLALITGIKSLKKKTHTTPPLLEFDRVGGVEGVDPSVH